MALPSSPSEAGFRRYALILRVVSVGLILIIPWSVARRLRERRVPPVDGAPAGAFGAPANIAVPATTRAPTITPAAASSSLGLVSPSAPPPPVVPVSQEELAALEDVVADLLPPPPPTDPPPDPKPAWPKLRRVGFAGPTAIGPEQKTGAQLLAPPPVAAPPPAPPAAAAPAPTPPASEPVKPRPRSFADDVKPAEDAGKGRCPEHDWWRAPQGRYRGMMCYGRLWLCEYFEKTDRCFQFLPSSQYAEAAAKPRVPRPPPTRKRVSGQVEAAPAPVSDTSAIMGGTEASSRGKATSFGGAGNAIEGSPSP